MESKMDKSFFKKLETFLNTTITECDVIMSHYYPNSSNFQTYDDVFVYLMENLEFINENIWDLYRTNPKLYERFNKFLIRFNFDLVRWRDPKELFKRPQLKKAIQFYNDHPALRIEMNVDRTKLIWKAYKRELRYTLASLHNSNQQNCFTEIPVDVIRLIGGMI